MVGPATPTGALIALLVPGSLLPATTPAALAGPTLACLHWAGRRARCPITCDRARCPVLPATPFVLGPGLLMEGRASSPVTCGRAVLPLAHDPPLWPTRGPSVAGLSSRLPAGGLPSPSAPKSLSLG